MKYYENPVGRYGNPKPRRPSDTATVPSNSSNGPLNPINDSNRPAEGMRRVFKDPGYRRANATGAAGSESLTEAADWACGPC